MHEGVHRTLGGCQASCSPPQFTALRPRNSTIFQGPVLTTTISFAQHEIAEELELPPVKVHCSILAEDAIKAAVSDYKKKHQA